MRLLFVVFLSLSFMHSALAHVYPSTADELTPEEAQELFRTLQVEARLMKNDSECFQRAHIWSLFAEKIHNVKTEKIFIYFTFKFQMSRSVQSGGFFGFGSKPITWWFHVAPAVTVNGDLWVLDPTFTDRAQPVQEWARSLMKEPEDCVEMNDTREYADDRNSSSGYTNRQNARETCYMSVAPRFLYQPLNMGLKDSKDGMQVISKPSDVSVWEKNTLKMSLESYKSEYRKAARGRLGI